MKPHQLNANIMSQLQIKYVIEDTSKHNTDIRIKNV